ncbi:hypothetical protein PML95_02370 [Vagococcus lutrae]|uniref:Gram-positive cocci surface proteins LPxTG domain-containing protein n=1 Tax=Vagococcus lutrae TaxID=81947 RepID=A0AAF0BCV9_9ENTE|nr:hypothetical protein [Vagococcus lutrae]WCG23103.1 hypothetical protein PML95_02370 [Vagococcus lutrae]
MKKSICIGLCSAFLLLSVAPMAVKAEEVIDDNAVEEIIGDDTHNEEDLEQINWKLEITNIIDKLKEKKAIVIKEQSKALLTDKIQQLEELLISETEISSENISSLRADSESLIAIVEDIERDHPLLGTINLETSIKLPMNEKGVYWGSWHAKLPIPKELSGYTNQDLHILGDINGFDDPNKIGLGVNGNLNADNEKANFGYNLYKTEDYLGISVMTDPTQVIILNTNHFTVTETIIIPTGEAYQLNVNIMIEPYVLEQEENGNSSNNEHAENQNGNNNNEQSGTNPQANHGDNSKIPGKTSEDAEKAFVEKVKNSGDKSEKYVGGDKLPQTSQSKTLVASLSVMVFSFLTALVAKFKF